MVSESLSLGDTGAAQGMGLDPTFGITNDRINTDNLAGEINEFVPYVSGSVPKADQYSERLVEPNYESYHMHHDTTNSSGTGLYTEAGVETLGFQCGGGDWPDHAESPSIPEAARPYVDEV